MVLLLSQRVQVGKNFISKNEQKEYFRSSGNKYKSIEKPKHVRIGNEERLKKG